MATSNPDLLKAIKQATYANLSYAEIEKSGRPSPPLAFPAPRVHRVTTKTVTVKTEKESCDTSAILYVDEESSSADAYMLPGTIIKQTLCGEVRRCLVLKSLKDGMTYTKTGRVVAIKMDRRKNMRLVHDTGHSSENPWKEVSALEFIQNFNNSNNIVNLEEALIDDNCLYEIMPFYKSTLDDLMVHHPHGLEEDQARSYFQGVLAGLHQLHSHGICHRDLSTHNVLIDDQNQCVLIDFGMCQRIPYPYPDEYFSEDATDISAGTTRRLIHSHSHCGKLRFMAPEMYAMKDFDGLSVDLWSAGVILFIMLTGRNPYEKPDRKDPGYYDLMDASYYWDPKGVNQLFSWGHTVSDEAVDLLKGIFQPEPKDRITLRQVAEHPWVVGCCKK